MTKKPRDAGRRERTEVPDPDGETTERIVRDAGRSPQHRKDEDCEDALDEALKETFPASDPIALSKRAKPNPNRGN
jgi:hypothetical protein